MKLDWGVKKAATIESIDHGPIEPLATHHHTKEGMHMTAPLSIVKDDLGVVTSVVLSKNEGDERRAIVTGWDNSEIRTLGFVVYTTEQAENVYTSHQKHGAEVERTVIRDAIIEFLDNAYDMSETRDSLLEHLGMDPAVLRWKVRILNDRRVAIGFVVVEADSAESAEELVQENLDIETSYAEPDVDISFSYDGDTVEDSGYYEGTFELEIDISDYRDVILERLEFEVTEYTG